MKITFITIFLIAIALGCFAQTEKEKTDDAGRIALFPYVPKTLGDMSPQARDNLAGKLSKIVTKNGIGGSVLNRRFIITAKVVELDKNISATTPAIYTYNLEVTLMVGDGIEGTLFSSYAFEAKGSGKSETQAYMSALKSISISNPKYQEFLDEAKAKIVDYYESKCDFLLKEAASLADQKEFDAAISKLLAVPDVCKDCFMKAQDAIKPMYQAYIDDQCKRLLNDAKNAWNSDQTWSGAEVAGGYLSAIDPDAACYSEATQLMNTIQKKVLADETRDWNFKMKVWNDQVSLESQRIKAVRDVGVAWGENQPENTYHITTW